MSKPQLSGGRTDRETFDRAVRLVAMLYAGQAITAKTIMREFNVALSTAHRDIVALECLLPLAVELVHQSPWPNPRKVVRLMRQERKAA